VDRTAEALSVEEKKRAAPQGLPGAGVHQMVALPHSLLIFQNLQDVRASLILPALYVLLAYVRRKICQAAAPAAKTLLLPVTAVVFVHFSIRLLRVSHG